MGHRGFLSFCIACILFCFALEVAALDKQDLGKNCYSILHPETGEKVDPERKRACLKKAYQPTVHLVVTPTRRAEALAKVPASVDVITQKEIANSSAGSVAELLRDVAGVQVSDAGQAGIKRIRIRGEESRRVRILIDGQEFSDEREVGTPLLISPEAIERIEVVRGTGSVLHGSRAIGGVVNIITKKGGYHPFQGTVSTSYDSATDGYQSYASIFGEQDDWAYRLSGSLSEHADRDSPDGELDNTSYDNSSFSAFVSRYLGDNHTLSLAFDDYRANSDVYVDPVVASSPPFLEFSIDAPKRDRSKVGLFYDGENLDGALEKVHFDAYYQESDRIFKTFSITELDIGMGPVISETGIETDSTLDTLGANTQFDFALSDSNSLIVGLETKKDDLDQRRTKAVTRSGATLPTELVIDEASQMALELFAEDVWDLEQDWQIRGGARAFWIDSELDKTTRPGLTANSTDDTHVVGAASVNYSGIENSTLWLGWSQGYVFPTLINLGTGAFAGPSFVNPNPDLDAETSNSVEIGFRHDGDLINFDAALFYTEGEDFIDHILCSATATACIQPAGSRDRVYVNIDEVQSFGAELKVDLELEHFTPYANTTWLRRKFEGETLNTYDTAVPVFSSRLGLRAETTLTQDVLGWADVYVRADTESRELEGDGEVLKKPGWATINFSIGTAFGEKENLKLVLDVLNLGDKKYVESTENLLARGRSAIVKFVANF